MKIFSYIQFLVFILIAEVIKAQELSNIGKSPLLNVSGGISLNQIGSFTSDTLSLRDPYSFTFMANLDISVYGWSIPLSVLYSNRQWSYQQPFNQFSLHPSYKWIKLHIGYSSMNFSQYTLAGHQFLGGGVELSPEGKFHFSAMTGRLQKRVLPDSSGFNEPAYERMASGFKTEYSSKYGTIGTTIFYAWDQPTPLKYIDTSKIIFPQENFVIGLNGNFVVIKNFNVNIEYALSTLSENTFALISEKKYALLPFYKRRESSHQYSAVQFAFSYSSQIGSIGFSLERVDPGYKTLGAYYNTNDFVNYTINYAGSILKNKISLACSYGLQKDDLSNRKSQQNIRNVGNINVSFSPKQTLNFNLFYSNFYNYTNIRTSFENINTTNPYGYLDTLSFTQISETYGGVINYSLGDKDKVRHNFSLSSTYQHASQKQTDNPSFAGNKFYIWVAGYNAKFTNDLSTGIVFNVSHNIADTNINNTVGPSLTINKTFFNKKLKIGSMFSYNQTLSNKDVQSKNKIIRLSSGYVYKKQHNFSLSIISAFRDNIKLGSRNECTINFTYSYNFNIINKKEKTNEEIE